MKTYLRENFFTDKESPLVEAGELKASLFTYSTGIRAVRISNSKGSATVLPFDGQAVWRCDFLGRELAMKSIYDEPEKCSFYGDTYGFFIMHCGLTAMGNPTSADTHPGHGELPLARYEKAWVETGRDDRGAWIAVGGVYAHRRCFAANYEFRPTIKLREGATSLEIDVEFTNLKDLPLEYYYLCHINHRPVDGSRLYYTADPKKAIINREVPDGYRSDWASATNAWLDEFAKDPSCGDVIGAKGESYRPEIVNCFMHHAARDGWAYTMQMEPSGTAIYVKHDPRQLPYGTRWIARTEDEDALGMCLPATSEHKGRLYCQEHGQQRILKTGKTVRYHIETGLLDRKSAAAMKRLIASAKVK